MLIGIPVERGMDLFEVCKTFKGTFTSMKESLWDVYCLE